MVSPTEADAGNVIVQAFEVVLIQYPLPATAVKVEPVTIVCHSIPASTAPQLKSVPSDVNTVPAPPLVKIAVAALAFP